MGPQTERTQRYGILLEHTFVSTCVGLVIAAAGGGWCSKQKLMTLKVDLDRSKVNSDIYGTDAEHQCRIS